MILIGCLAGSFPGEYNTYTQSGQELLGHELTHVVQQRAGRGKPDTQQGKDGMNINSDKSLENEADYKYKDVNCFVIVKLYIYLSR